MAIELVKLAKEATVRERTEKAAVERAVQLVSGSYRMPTYKVGIAKLISEVVVPVPDYRVVEFSLS